MMNKQNNAGHKKTLPAPRLNNEIPFPDEIEHLFEISRKLEDALLEADSVIDRTFKQYMSEKRYMAQYRGEIDPHEMFQNELALKQIDSSGAFAVKTRAQLAKLKNSPYFARVDFRKTGAQKASKYYIGPFSFTHKNELLICDWRSPVASLFYDCGVGPAAYDAPVGRVAGNLTKKRQFKIKDGQMEYALETSVNIQDDVLQRELSHTSDEKMKSIIATIQKEQNKIIRNENAQTLIIQGVAGSGKTSIALHRLAFLLYRFKDRLSARNVTILSPNKVFGDYISGVLPELGEEPIYEISFADIAAVQLEGTAQFEPDKDPLETQDEKWAQRVRFKSTLNFVKRLDCYLERLPELIFQPADYNCGGFTFKADMIQSRFAAYKKYPVKRRLLMIADDIYDRFETDPFMQEDIPKRRTILKSLTAMLKVKNSLALYKDFYRQQGLTDMLVMPDKKTLEWSDVFPFLYIHAAFEGLKESGVIKHLVVDEMQDYTPVQYAVLNLLFKCQKTILGDFGQFLNPNHQYTLEDLRQLYDGAEFVELNKSYRSTFEIMNFAKQIQSVNKAEPVARHGEEPVLLRCENKQEQTVRIEAMIDAFKGSGHASLCIITKTNSDAEALFNVLSHKHTVCLLSPQSSQFVNGVSVTSVQMSKGLEFDEVIIPDADNTAYKTEYDRSLLYIACTRAMHKLSLTYTGEPSCLTDKKHST